MKKVLIIVFVFLNLLCSAQGKSGMVHLETTDYKGVKKEFDAKCFVVTVIKANSTFATVLFDKALIPDSKEIKVYLGQQGKAEPAIITIPVNGENVVQSAKLAGIPYQTIRQLAQNTVLVKPTFFPEDLIPQSIKGATDKDIEDFIAEMEKWAGY
ncbi:MAG: hypothetical protein QM710_03455 [Flavobacterium sp.]